MPSGPSGFRFDASNLGNQCFEHGRSLAEGRPRPLDYAPYMLTIIIIMRRIISGHMDFFPVPGILGGIGVKKKKNTVLGF